MTSLAFTLAAVNTTNRYPYELPPATTALGILIYLGLSAWMAHLSMSYTEVPHFGFIALSVIFGTLALTVLVRRLAFPCTIELTDDAILLPIGHPWPRITTIPYADIISIKDNGDNLAVATGNGSFWVGSIKFEGYRAVREIISIKTGIGLEPLDRTIRTKFNSDELPEPLVQWVEPEVWSRFRNRAERSMPVLHHLRTELRFFVRCYVFCCIFIVAPFLVFLLVPSFYLAGPSQLIAVSISPFRNVSVLAIFFTMLHWLYGTFPVRSDTRNSFRDCGITQNLPNGQQFHWNYRQICGWTVIEKPFKGHILQILLLKWQEKGRTGSVAIALPDAAVRDQVVQILNEKQLPQMPDLKPSWEAE